MSETPGVYNVPRPQPAHSFEAQINSLPPDVRSVAESLALRDIEGARRYVAQFVGSRRGG